VSFSKYISHLIKGREIAHLNILVSKTLDWMLRQWPQHYHTKVHAEKRKELVIHGTTVSFAGRKQEMMFADFQAKLVGHEILLETQ
jgi:hypothetical protein